ncbi:FAD-dependent oxidoreductase [Aspergillus mulundensis]|uniref:FAD-binding domain-containing protein n=1 Tax=Aspergillus mulundensis TaxID=1810919 RepID=A0A3D8R4P1_9EURO|nr:Uncharacterized protein DSM5745_08707 [Aspergillus mulundensis]RDW68947.1 Uncharacterized protein DSM5745_08707 [Aspergillus mulundensis]
MSSSRKAIIIGAGPAGLSAALRLHQTTNIKPVIYELRPEPTTLGGAIGIPSNGLRLLDRLGVYDALLKRGSSHSGFAMYSLTRGRLGGLEDFVAHARAETGYGYMRVKRVDVVDVLLDAVQKAEIPVYFGRKLVGVLDGEDKVGVSAQFEDGSTDNADILLGCDGIHSAVRRMYVDPDQKPEYSGLSGMFSIIPASRLSESATRQMTGLSVTLTEQGIFMAAPCTAGKDEIYWGFQREIPVPDTQHSRDGWEVRGRQEVDGFRDNLHETLANGQGDWIDTLRQLVDATNVIKLYPIYRLPLGGTWSRGRCLLLGDAAHATQPHAGQGVSLALEDVFLICRLLADPTRSIEEAYASFHRIRSPRVAEIHQTAARNGAVRKNAGPFGQWLKETALWLALSVPSGLGIGDRLLGQKHSTYDIEEEEILNISHGSF